MEKSTSSIEIVVVEFGRTGVQHAVVTLAPAAGPTRHRPGFRTRRRGPVNVAFDDSTRTYRAADIPSGTYRLVVSAPGFATEERVIALHEGEHHENVVLASAGTPYYYSYGRKVHFNRTDTWVVSVPESHRERFNHRAAAIAHEEGIEIQHESGHEGAPGRLLVRAHGNDNRKRVDRLYRRLRKEGIEVHVLPEISRGDAPPLLLTNVGVAQFEPGLTHDEIEAELRRCGLILLAVGGGLPNTVKIAPAGDGTEFDLLKGCNMLVESGSVISAYPDRFVPAAVTAIIPNDFLFPQQWTLATAGLSDAWQHLRDLTIARGIAAGDARDVTYGSADVVIAIVDMGIETTTPPGGVPTPNHADFNVNVNGGTVTPITILPSAAAGTPKGYKFHDFRSGNGAGLIAMRTDNDTVRMTGAHGMATGGVAAAATGVVEGITGAIPNARLIGAQLPFGTTEPFIANQNWCCMWEWLGGARPSWALGTYVAGEVFPDRFGTGANPGSPAGIISNSLTLHLIDRYEDVVDAVSWFGRGRRGGFMVLAAGNEDKSTLLFGNKNDHRKLFVIAASSVDESSLEIRSAYSNYYDGVPATVADSAKTKKPDKIGSVAMVMDVCGPSRNFTEYNNNAFPPGPTASSLSDPGVNNMVYTASRNTQGGVPHNDVYPGITIQGPAPVIGGVTVVVDDRPAYAGGGVALIGTLGTANAEGASIIGVVHTPGAVPPTMTLTLSANTPLRKAHAVGESVYIGNPNYRDNFGGTSAACPLVAGIIGLMISARPTLSNQEVRNLLHTTAVPIDLREIARNKWKGTDPANAGTPNTAANPLLDVATANGLLVQSAGGANLAMTTTNAPVVIAANRTTLNVASELGFHPGQAILIGAETTLTAPTVAANAFIMVASNRGFAIGQTIRIGAGYSTYLVGIGKNAAGTALDMTKVYVGNTRGFLANHRVLINGAPYTVAAIIDSQLMQLTTPYPAPLAWPHVPRVRVELDQTIDVAISGLVGTTRINFAAPLGVVIPSAPRTIVRVIETETTVIREVHPGQLIVYPMAFDHPAGTPVIGGLRPYYSQALGFGRVDSEKAVEAAINYNHAHRDLMIRHNLADIGERGVAAGAIDTPDIWVRNVGPSTDRRAAMPAGYPATASKSGQVVNPAAGAALVAGPHQNPKVGNDRWIYARIRNRGTNLQSLDAEVRFYISYRTAPPTSIDAFQQNPDNAYVISSGYVISAGVEGTQYLGSEYIYAQSGANREKLTAGIDSMHDYIVWTDKWKAAIKPPVVALAARKRTFIFAEITPHDGVVLDAAGAELPGTTIGQNNNLTYKEVSFATVVIEKKTGATTWQKMTSALKIPRSGAQDFRVKIDDTLGYFMAENVSIEVTAVGVGAATLVHAPGGYTLGGGAPAWITFGALVASGRKDTLTFTGSLTGLPVNTKVKIKVKIVSESGETMVSEEIATVLQYEPVKYQELELRSPNRPETHMFAEHAKLVQTPELAFGAKSESAFRLTSSFTATATGDDAPKAYAATSGTLMIQRVKLSDGTYDPHRVNAILKPTRQTALGIAPVKYFIYRGLDLADFLSADGSHVRASGTGVSTLIETLYTYNDQRIDDFNNSPLHTSRPAACPDPIPSSMALGWDSTRDGAETIRSQFNDNGPNFQMPYVAKGLYIGKFHAPDATSEFGFEIVLEGTHEPTLDHARLAYCEKVVTVDEGEEETFEQRHEREEILNFIDPAAYFGMHFTDGVYTREDVADSERRKEQALYDDVLSKFATKNCLYIDVRSEHGYSMNYYRNYNPDGGQIRLGADLNFMGEEPYHTEGWPLVVLERSQEERDLGEDGSLFIGMHRGDNTEPIAYVEKGDLFTATTAGAFVADDDLVGDDPEWTKELGIRPASASDAAANETLDVAGLVRIHYGRSAVQNPVFNNTSVVRTEKPLDNVFGPVGLDTGWNVGTEIKTEWMSMYDRRIVKAKRSNPEKDFTQLVERGFASQEGQVVFYAAAVDFMAVDGATVPSAQGSEGGFSPREHFIDASSLFAGLDIQHVDIHDTLPSGTPVNLKLMNLTSVDGNTPPEGMMILALDRTMYDNLKTAATNALSTAHRINFVLEEQTIPNGDGSFSRFVVKARGLDATTHESADAGLTGDGLVVYSADGVFFMSAGVNTDALIPVEYHPDPEEARAFEHVPVDLLELHPSLRDKAGDFASAVSNATIADDGNAQATLLTRASDFGRDIWTLAKENATSGYIDDRQLYWARLRMQVALKMHSHALKNTADRDILVKRLEQKSRGFLDLTFPSNPGPNDRKILISGFDPFQLGDKIDRSNPSGIVALALDGQTVSKGGLTGYIQSVIFPVRYEDFDAGMVEEFFEPYLYGAGKVSMIVTISQNGGHGYIDIERFAGITRGGGDDNEDRGSAATVGTGTNWAQYYETTLPVAAMMTGVTIPDSDQVIFFDQSYKARKVNGDEIEGGEAAQGDPNTKTKVSINLVTDVATVLEGSGGDYLSNEIFYRVAHLRDVPPSGQTVPSAVKTGHLHIPQPERMSGPNAMTIQQLVEQVKTLLTDALPGL